MKWIYHSKVLCAVDSVGILVGFVEDEKLSSP